MEYKADEKEGFELAQAMARTGDWPPVGKMSGVGVVDPGLSLWIFGILAKVSGAAGPISLTRAVQLLNVFSILAFFALIWKWLLAEDREPWLWSAALLSVSPYSVLYSRKIWEPNVVPPFFLLTLAGFLHRGTFFGAIAYGLFGALIGQIHMSGFFLSLGLMIWIALFDRRSLNWLGWFAGSVVGALPLLPWIAYVLREPGPAEGWLWPNIRHLLFYRQWFKLGFGIGLDYPLGTQMDEFLRTPMFGTNTYAGKALVTGTWILLAIFVAFVAAGYLRKWDRVAFRDWTSTELFTNGVFFGMGGLFTIAGFLIFPHYLNIILPVLFLWIASLAIRFVPKPTVFLASLWLVQLSLSALFLVDIHKNCGAPGGDYGTSFRCQATPGAR